MEKLQEHENWFGYVLFLCKTKQKRDQNRKPYRSELCANTRTGLVTMLGGRHAFQTHIRRHPGRLLISWCHLVVHCLICTQVSIATKRLWLWQEVVMTHVSSSDLKRLHAQLSSNPMKILTTTCRVFTAEWINYTCDLCLDLQQHKWFNSCLPTEAPLCTTLTGRLFDMAVCERPEPAGLVFYQTKTTFIQVGKSSETEVSLNSQHQSLTTARVLT